MNNSESASTSCILILYVSDSVDLTRLSSKLHHRLSSFYLACQCSNLSINFLFSLSIVNVSDKGPFKCYVTQMGLGVSDFPEKSVTKV